MAQNVEELSCTHSADSETHHGDKESSSVYRTDFSVTNRLLTPYNSNVVNNNLPAHVPSVTISYRNGGDGYHQPGAGPSSSSSLPGWQSLLPNDQGGLSAKSYNHKSYSHSSWRNSVPNAHLSPQRASSSMYHQSYGANSGASTSYSPDSSTGMLSFSTKDAKDGASGSGDGLSNGERSVIKDYCQQVSQTPTKQEEESEEESNDTSSNHSSQGDTGSCIDEPKKAKRTRTAFSNLQLDQLELAFSRSHYPDVFTREDLSNKLNIREDRIQVWFQNRRARYRKQERTGSISLRSKYRQKRLQKIQQCQAAAAAATMYGYYPSCGNSGGSNSSTQAAMLTSPQQVSPYMPGFTFPPSYVPSTMSGAVGAGGGGATAAAASTSRSDGLAAMPSTVASPPGYLPIKGSIPLPGYMAMPGLGHSSPPTYGTYTAPHAGMVTSVTQK